MEIKKDITIHLSETDIKEIIADYLKREGYEVAVNNVRLSVGTEIQGYGLGELEVTCFKGANVRISR